MRVGILGINHKLASLELRELLAQTCHQRLASDQSMHGEHHLILLSTCNRTEVYFSSEDLTLTHSYLLNILRRGVNEDFDQKLYSYFGQDCLAHLCRVTTGLDSAIVAETEIQGQVKNAYEKAKEHRQLPHEMHYLFQKALQIGKKIRNVLPAKPGLPDIEHAIVQTGESLLKEKGNAKILFVGASNINIKILAHLKHKNYSDITLCNRSYDNAKNIAQQYQIPCIAWELLQTWQTYDWVILGTKAPDYLIHAQQPMIERTRQKLIIDLSVPRNVDPAIGNHPHITLLNIDQVNQQLKIRKEHLHSSLALAETMVNEAIGQQFARFHRKETNRLQICAFSA